MKIAVVGSGIGGLASAILLQRKGHQVTVYEKNSCPGGKMGQINVDGYRFDTGPSLFTLPELVDELFELCSVQETERLPYVRLSNNCRYFYPDGTEFNFYQDREALYSEIERVFPHDAAAVRKRLLHAEEVYNLSAPVFLFSAFHKLSNYLTEPYRHMVFKLHKLDFFRTMHGANAKDFTDLRLVQLFDRYATYNGSSPFRAPATLNMIAHLENNKGAFFPVKGMYSIANSLYDLALKQGVRFEFNTRVEEIIRNGAAVSGIRTASGITSVDAVVSDVDVRSVANHLLKHPLKRIINKIERSSSALIFYWGINRSFPRLDVHNILFSSDYREEFRHLFKEKSLSADPTVYLFISSKIVPDDAPAGCENWFVMVNAPSDCGQAWDKLIAEARKNILRKIDKMLGVDIGSCIVTERIASPLTIARDTFSANGALYGTSSNSLLAAFLRHPNTLPGIKNLYFVGGSVHPGGGIPLCIASAKIVSNEIPDAL